MSLGVEPEVDAMEDETEVLTNEAVQMCESEDTMFTTPGPMSDVTLLVEGRVLHVSRCVLSLASPVFRKMLEGEFKDKEEITLLDKKYNDMVELLLCIYPSTTKIITKSNLEIVLPLADEYKMESLKERCCQILLQQLQHDQRYNQPTNEQLVHFLYLADKYKVEALIEESVEKGKFISLNGENGLMSFPEFQKMSVEAKYRICNARLSNLEGPLKRLIIAGKNVQHVSTAPASYPAGFFSLGSPVQTSAFEQSPNTLKDMVNSLSRHFHNDPTL